MSQEFQIKLTVALLCYNHEKYLAQALDSVLMQETDQPFEIVIGDDHSTDGSLKILAEYKEKYPDKITLIAHDKNLGNFGKNNFLSIYQHCRGEYLVVLEGDDFWTDSRKLQKQIDLLDSNPDVAVVYHPVRFLYEETKEDSEIWPVPAPEKATFEDLLKRMFIPTCAAMFRFNRLVEFPEEYFRSRVGDQFFFLLFAQHGTIAGIPETMAVRRCHPQGGWAPLEEKLKVEEKLILHKAILSYFGPQYRRTVYKLIAAIYGNYARYLCEGQSWMEALKELAKCFLWTLRAPALPTLRSLKTFWIIVRGFLRI